MSRIPKAPRTGLRRVVVSLEIAFCYVLILLGTVWAALALYLDFNFPSLRIPLTCLYILLILGLMVRFRLPLVRLLAAGLCFGVVVVWWLSLAPSNNGNWWPDVSRPAYAVVQGNHITFYNVRSCDYRTEMDYSCQWLTREIDLGRIQGVDLFMNYWGSPPLSKLIAHTILSFEIGADPSSANPGAVTHIAFSIEARKKVGESYSSLRGFFRQYTLISVVSDERDLVRLRTNYRQGEDLYLYRTKATPEFARSLMMDYVAFTNALHDHPKWYNAVTGNCTTEIFTFKAMKVRPLDWRILLNGKADEMLYDQDELEAEQPGLPGHRLSFEELKRSAHINPAAKAADADPAFSERIREGRPGFP